MIDEIKNQEETGEESTEETEEKEEVEEKEEGTGEEAEV